MTATLTASLLSTVELAPRFCVRPLCPVDPAAQVLGDRPGLVEILDQGEDRVRGERAKRLSGGQAPRLPRADLEAAEVVAEAGGIEEDLDFAVRRAEHVDEGVEPFAGRIVHYRLLAKCVSARASARARGCKRVGSGSERDAMGKRCNLAG
jgi:hypothetical protein